MKLLGLNPDFTAHQRMICVAFSSVVGTCGDDASQLTASREKVQLVPSFGGGCRHDTLCCGFIWEKVL